MKEILFAIVLILAVGVSSCCDGTLCSIDKGGVEDLPVVETPSSIIEVIDSLDYIQTDPCTGENYSYDEFEINILEYDSLPYVQHDGVFTLAERYDINGVPVHEFQGRLNYHPVAIVQYGLQQLDVYHDFKRPELLKSLISIADKLIAISLEFKSTIFLPYSFDFPLHGIHEETLWAPWFSGMAQGQALSFFVRLYEETEDLRYLDLSKKFFHSFVPLKGRGHNPWVSCVDQNGNLWIEEYPEETPALTLNGMNFAIYGLYDYYRVTRKQEAKIVLMAALTTIKKNIKKFRREGGVSVYCLKHNIQNEYYHGVHVKQLHDLFMITGDQYFEEMSMIFKSDFNRFGKTEY